MKLLLENLDIPMALAGKIIGAVVSLAGVVGTALYGSYHRLATIDPQELAIQPIHVVLIGFIVALATFIVLILRAVWGKGVSTVDKFSASLDSLANEIRTLVKTQDETMRQFQNISLDALRESMFQKSLNQEK